MGNSADENQEGIEPETTVGDGMLSTTSRRHITIPLALIILWGAYDVIVFQLLDRRNISVDFIEGLVVVGPCFGHVLLWATWAAWGLGAAMVRWLTVVAMLVAQSICVAENGDLMGPLIPLSLIFVTCSLFLLAVRGVGGWSILRSRHVSTKGESGRYAVRHLLGLMTLVAILASAAKLTSVFVDVPPQLRNVGELGVAAVVFFLCTAPVVLLLAAVLSVEKVRPQRLFLALATIAVATTAAAAVAYELFPGPFLVNLERLGGTVAGASWVVVVSASLLRQAGYRVARKPGISGAGGGVNTV
jgi:hypothetical protein